MEEPTIPGAVPDGDAFHAPATGAYPPPSSYAQQPYTEPAYTQPPYTQTAYANTGAAARTDQGLTDSQAGAIAYITIIPAIVFLLLAPYNTRPFVKFHAFQSLALGVVWFCLGIIGVIPVLGWVVLGLGSIALLICWILSLVKAAQGSYLKLPVISDFASKQSGYAV